MRPATWRALVLMMCAVAVVLTGANAINYFGFAGKAAWSGNPGMSLGTSGEPYRAAILTVDPGGSAGRAGLHSGDRFDIRANAVVERWQLLSGNALVARPITLLLQRGLQQREIAIAPQPWEYGRNSGSSFSGTAGYCCSLFSPRHRMAAARGSRQPPALDDPSSRCDRHHRGPRRLCITVGLGLRGSGDCQHGVHRFDWTLGCVRQHVCRTALASSAHGAVALPRLRGRRHRR